ncbi:FliM/FliN family flagellar motor switch protein [Microbulbifer sp. TYP-18]|uniref:FliM/FliN family flagellar motor switch protein n=1 Tax=Microbulbifer sp. TYP-18 TaxID=3230024 RepID=UPI0034C5B23F
MSEPVEVELVELEEATEKLGERIFKRLNPNILKGIEVEVKINIGSAKISVERLMTLSKGEIVQLDTPSSQKINLLVGSQVVAKGLLVVVNGHYGLQVSEVVA